MARFRQGAYFEASIGTQLCLGGDWTSGILVESSHSRKEKREAALDQVRAAGVFVNCAVAGCKRWVEATREIGRERGKRKKGNISFCQE